MCVPIMARLELKQLTKTFGTTLAVDQVDLTVEDQEFMALVGPSGCGKSTILRIVAGLETPSAGEVLIDGVSMNGVHPKDRDVAMVFQNYALYPHMTVAQNIGFGLKLRRVPRSVITEEVERVARTLGLTEVLKRKPAQLSGGQRQRVALGRAIVRRPKIFLFDEPLSNLDAKLRQETRYELGRLRHELGATMVYVTHDQVEAMTLGTRVAVLADGRLQQVSTPLEVYRSPANLFVASFIGSPTINRLEGRFTEAAFVHAGGAIPLDGVGSSLQGHAAIFAIRPEAVLLAPEGAGLSAKIDLVEPLGAETLVHLQLEVGGAPLVMRITQDRDWSRGAVLSVQLDPVAGHFFDAATGARLAPATPAAVD